MSIPRGIGRQSILRLAAMLKDTGEPEDEAFAMKLERWVERNDALPPGQKITLTLEIIR